MHVYIQEVKVACIYSTSVFAFSIIVGHEEGGATFHQYTTYSEGLRIFLSLGRLIVITMICASSITKYGST